MEIKLEQWDHDLDHLLGILSEAFLQLPSVTHQHLTRSGLLLQTSSPYPKTLLQSENENIHIQCPCGIAKPHGNDLNFINNMKWDLLLLKVSGFFFKFLTNKQPKTMT